MSKPKISISLYTYGGDLQTGRMTVNECIEHAASLGVDGIEFVDRQHIAGFPHPRIYDLIGLRECVESFGMQVACYGTYVDDWVKPDQRTTYDQIVSAVREQIAQASVLGARVLRPGPFFEGQCPPYGRSRPWVYFEDEHPPYKSWSSWVSRIVKEVLPDLKKFKVVWGTEIHAPMPPLLVLEMTKNVNDEHVRLIPDFSVWQRQWFGHVGSSIGTFKAVVPYAVHIHAKVNVFDEKGEEPNTPYSELIPILKKSGFDGYISAENECWSGGRYVNSRRMAKMHVDLIRRYL